MKDQPKSIYTHQFKILNIKVSDEESEKRYQNYTEYLKNTIELLQEELENQSKHDERFDTKCIFEGDPEWDSLDEVIREPVTDFYC